MNWRNSIVQDPFSGTGIPAHAFLDSINPLESVFQVEKGSQARRCFQWPYPRAYACKYTCTAPARVDRHKSFAYVTRIFIAYSSSRAQWACYATTGHTSNDTIPRSMRTDALSTDTRYIARRATYRIAHFSLVPRKPGTNNRADGTLTDQQSSIIGRQRQSIKEQTSCATVNFNFIAGIYVSLSALDFVR